ncbi:rCG43697 [Rattus norvegicus]|uniref:RCG43697 n=1 Tax=Rattus norvegicus TaxID=10116 RepID=A6JJ43_RAT|nr:rCG43697 [Rattus norvegicus]
MTKVNNRLTQKSLPLEHCLLFGNTTYTLGRCYAMGALPTYWEHYLFRILAKPWEHYLSFRIERSSRTACSCPGIYNCPCSVVLAQRLLKTSWATNCVWAFWMQNKM